MKKTPDLIFIIDTNIESLAVAEAKKLVYQLLQFLILIQIQQINFPIPGNDDARRSINLYCELLKNTIKDAEKFIAITNNNTKKDKNTSDKKEK